jgi:hypothetical protein
LRPYSPGGALIVFTTTDTASKPHQSSVHRLRRGLPGYLILFAPHAFVPERQKGPADRLHHRHSIDIYAFHRSTYVLAAPTCSRSSSSPCCSPVEPRDFTKRFPDPPAHPLSPVIPINARGLCITATAGTELVATSSGDNHWFSPDSGLHGRGRFIPHAALLRQACAHCGRFVTAASRRSPGSVSVPMSQVVLSHPLPVFGLVGHYPANYLIGRSPLPRRLNLSSGEHMESYAQFPMRYPPPRGTFDRITDPFATCPCGHVRLACFSHAASVQSEP